MEKTVYKGNIIQVTEEEIGGIVWERAYLPTGVIIFPITQDGRILLVKEKRPHETPPFRIKPVAGMLEPEKGSPAENAQREMQEEIGLRAGQLENFMTLEGTGTVTHKQYFFLARDLTPAKLPNPDGEDTIMEVLAYGPDEIHAMLMNDQIKWSVSTLGLFRLLEMLRSGSLQLNR
jgi:8-oxo-dGTP pyrophosphatase MutT (NUDIX family)